MADLYHEIEKLIQARLRETHLTGQPVDITDWVSQLTESLADMIVFGTPAELQDRMLIFARERLDQFVSENRKLLAEEERAAGGLH